MASPTPSDTTSNSATRLDTPRYRQGARLLWVALVALNLIVFLSIYASYVPHALQGEMIWDFQVEEREDVAYTIADDVQIDYQSDGMWVVTVVSDAAREMGIQVGDVLLDSNTYPTGPFDSPYTIRLQRGDEPAREYTFNRRTLDSGYVVTYVSEAAQAAGLRLGDVLTGEFPGGFGPIGELATFSFFQIGEDVHQVTLPRQPYDPVVLGVTRLGLPAGVGIALYLLLDVGLLIGSFAIALLMFWLRSDDWMALALALAVTFLPMMSASSYSDFNPISGLYPTATSNWFNLYGIILMVPVVLIFPDGRLRPRSTAVIAVGVGLLYAFYTQDYPAWGLQLLNLGTGLTLVGVQTYRYRRYYTPTQRQQTKWVIIGIASVALSYILQALSFTDVISVENYPLWELITEPIRVALIFVLPITIIFAMFRYRLYDVDVALNRSLVSAVVTVILGAVFLLIFAIGQAALGALMGTEQAALSGAAAAVIAIGLFNPTRKRVRHFIDRRIYGLRFDLNELGAAQKLPDVKNPGALTGRKLGDYDVLGVLGKGGMGEVYKGIGSAGEVALKILPADLAQQQEFRVRFEREAATLTALNHPNIVKMYGSGETDGIFYMAMEYIDGQELGRLIKQQGKLSVEQIQPFISDFASALDYAHAQGLVHRDIKPSNIMIRLKADNETSEAVLMDFGIAKIQDAQTRFTGSGAIGTIDYMAPEQIMTAKTVDKRADIYALGVVLFEMLTGEKPFKGSPAQVMFAHLQQPAPDPRDIYSDIPRHIAQAVMRALSKDADDRFATVSEFAAALG